VRWLVTVAAAALLGAGFALQQRAAQRGPAPTHPVRLLFRLLQRPKWLAGIAAMVAGQLLSAWALGQWQLTFVEPVLATNLVFALVFAVVLSGQSLRPPEVLGALLLCGGVVAFTLPRGTYRQAVAAGPVGAWVAAGAVAALAALLVWRGWRLSPYPRAALVGTAAGLVFGIQDALTRDVMRLFIGPRWWEALTGPTPYLLLAVAITGILLMQSAFGSAPLRASLAPITAAEPVAGMALGVLVFGDPLPATATAITIEAFGLSGILLGLVMVSRSRALTGHHHLHLGHLGHLGHEKHQTPSGSPETTASPADDPQPATPAAHH
jgi:drug/metabolite transporter (DMT)-like permease